jgi:hypothetical protein
MKVDPKAITEANRRLAILVALSLATQYKLTVRDTRTVVDGCGYPASLATLGADIQWLRETGLIGYDADTEVLSLTDRGLDVVNGVAEVPGVGRPGPGA